MSILNLLEKNIEKNSKNFSEFLDGHSEDVQRGSEFMLFALENVFHDKDISDIEQGIVDAAYRREKHDFGIDAVYITASGDFVEQIDDLEEYNEDTKFQIQFFQFKRGKSVSQSDILKYASGLKNVLIEEGLSDEDNLYFYNRMNVLNKIKNKLFEKFPAENIYVVCHIVFAGMENNLRENSLLSSELEGIKTELVNGGYTQSDVKIIDCTTLVKDPTKNQNIVDMLQYEQTVKYITDVDQHKKFNGYISIIKGSEVAELVRKYQSSIFEANIRDYFKRSDLNSKIIETSSHSEEAKYFWSFNNGLTVTCNKVEELPGNKYRLHNLQIVNGCQTSNAIYNAVRNREKISALKKKREEGQALTKVEKDEIQKNEMRQFNDDTALLVKIIETNDSDLVYRITETTNSQTPIKSFSLKANDEIQKSIEQFLEGHDISYERRINELRNKGRKNIYSIQKLFQLYFSQILFKPSQARTHPGRLLALSYGDVFPASHIKDVNYILYLIPIYVDIHLNTSIKKHLENADVDPYRKTLFSYGKLHLGCFLLNSILKNKHSEKGIIENETSIKHELENNLEYHFENSLNNFEKVMKSYAGNKKEAIAGAVRKKELDDKIVRFCKSQRSAT